MAGYDESTPCAKCGVTHRRLMRELCSSCYMRAYRDGTHIDFPRRHYRTEELVEFAAELLARRNDKVWVAEQLGVKWATINTARWRLRRRAEQREGENSEADLECPDRHRGSEDGARS